MCYTPNDKPVHYSVRIQWVEVMTKCKKKKKEKKRTKRRLKEKTKKHKHKTRTCAIRPNLYKDMNTWTHLDRQIHHDDDDEHTSCQSESHLFVVLQAVYCYPYKVLPYKLSCFTHIWLTIFICLTIFFFLGLFYFFFFVVFCNLISVFV